MRTNGYITYVRMYTTMIIIIIVSTYIHTYEEVTAQSSMHNNYRCVGITYITGGITYVLHCITNITLWCCSECAGNMYVHTYVRTYVGRYVSTYVHTYIRTYVGG